MTRAKIERLTGNMALVSGFLVAALMTASLLLDVRSAHAADFTVTSANGFGEGTLERVIRDANDNPGPDTIKFNITGGEGPVKTIAPQFGLPPITDPVTIDGYIQPSSRPNSRQSGGTDAVILVEINGADARSTDGLDIRANNVVVRGLAINRFASQGISIGGTGPVTGDKIEGNFIGTDTSGTLDRGNSFAGVLVREGGNNTIGGTTPEARNLISGQNFFGAVDLRGTGGNKVQGNLIGTQKDGTTILANTRPGVDVDSSNNTIGGTEPEAGNTIAFNSKQGVQVSDISTGKRVLGNSIFSNGGLGIDLLGEDSEEGRTLNDPRDLDTGANNLQHFPVITSAEKGLRRHDRHQWDARQHPEHPGQGQEKAEKEEEEDHLRPPGLHRSVLLEPPERRRGQGVLESADRNHRSPGQGLLHLRDHRAADVRTEDNRNYDRFSWQHL